MSIFILEYKQGRGTQESGRRAVVGTRGRATRGGGGGGGGARPDGRLQTQRVEGNSSKSSFHDGQLGHALPSLRTQGDILQSAFTLPLEA